MSSPSFQLRKDLIQPFLIGNAEGPDVLVDAPYQPDEGVARAQLDEGVNAFGYHILDQLFPLDGGSQEGFEPYPKSFSNRWKGLN